MTAILQTQEVRSRSPIEAARYIGTGRSFVYSLMKSGELRSVKMGRCRRILTEDLEAYLQKLKDEADQN